MITRAPYRSCSCSTGGSNPATPPPVEAPRSTAVISETPETSRAVLTDLTPATPIEGGLEGSDSGHAARGTRSELESRGIWRT